MEVIYQYIFFFLDGYSRKMTHIRTCTPLCIFVAPISLAGLASNTINLMSFAHTSTHTLIHTPHGVTDLICAACLVTKSFKTRKTELALQILLNTSLPSSRWTFLPLHSLVLKGGARGVLGQGAGETTSKSAHILSYQKIKP